MDPIVIVGTGLAGYGTARELRKHDKQVPLVLITRDDGANYYKPDLSEAHGQKKTPDQLVKKDAEAMAAELDADIRTYSQVEAVDAAARTITVNGDALSYSKLVLAAGAEPIVLTLGGDAIESIHKVNNLNDYRTFRRNLDGVEQVTLLGAGLIGCEFANDLVGAGYRVNAVDPAGWPLPQLLPEACGRAVERELDRAGVNWYLGRAAQAVHESGDRLQVVLDDDTSLYGEAVLSAVGLRAGLELARAAGLAIERGIVVDRGLRTSDAHIYAIGDCAEVAGHWRPYVGPLMQCARTLGKNLACGEGDTLGQVKYPTLPIIVKTHVCPVIVYPPVNPHGEWRIEGNAPDVEARFIDRDGNLQGFALTGAATQKRRDYLKQAPPLLA